MQESENALNEKLERDANRLRGLNQMKKTKPATITQAFEQAVNDLTPDKAIEIIEEAIGQFDNIQSEYLSWPSKDTQLRLNIVEKWIEKQAAIQPGQEIMIQVGSGEEPDVIRGTISEIKPDLIVVSSYKILARESLIIQEEARKQEPLSSELSEEQKIDHILETLELAEGGDISANDLLVNERDVMSAGDCLRITKELLEFGIIHAVRDQEGDILTYELA